MLWLAHLHVYPVLAGGALVAEGAGADHLGVSVDGDVAGRLVLAGVVLAQGVHLGSRQQIRIIRGANEEAGYESSDYDDHTPGYQGSRHWVDVLNLQNVVKSQRSLFNLL